MRLGGLVSRQQAKGPFWQCLRFKHNANTEPDDVNVGYEVRRWCAGCCLVFPLTYFNLAVDEQEKEKMEEEGAGASTDPVSGVPLNVFVWM